MKKDDFILLLISREFSKTPGPRFRKEGKYSGEEFREKILEPFFQRALDQGKKLIVNLDGGAGYGTSFLEEAFGGLARRYDNVKLISDNIDFISIEEPYLKDDILEYIKNAIG